MFPSSITLSFTPHFLGAWGGDWASTQCSSTVPTTPSCAVYREYWGALAEWYSCSEVELTMSLDPYEGDTNECARYYASNEVEATAPSGLPAWSSNPLGLTDSADHWCDIETDIDRFGDVPAAIATYWFAKVHVEAVQCSDHPWYGDTVNAAIITLEIFRRGSGVGNAGHGPVMTQRFISKTGNEDCSCNRSAFGSAWEPVCPAAECGTWNNTYEAVKFDISDYALGSGEYTNSDDGSDDCCDDITFDAYWAGGTGDEIGAPGCLPLEKSLTCPDAPDPWASPGPAYQLQIGDPNTFYHLAEKYCADSSGSPCISWKNPSEYYFSLSDTAAITDLSFGAL